MRILIAEDDVVSRHLLETTLTKWGYEVISTTDGLQALDVMSQPDAPSLAVLDWMMPGLDGAEVCRRARSFGTRPAAVHHPAHGQGAQGRHCPGSDGGSGRLYHQAVRSLGIEGPDQCRRTHSPPASGTGGPRQRVGTGAGQRQTVAGIVAHLLLLQKNPQRPQLLAAGGHVHCRPLGSAVHPRHLSGMPRENREDRNWNG